MTLVKQFILSKKYILLIYGISVRTNLMLYKKVFYPMYKKILFCVQKHTLLERAEEKRDLDEVPSWQKLLKRNLLVEMLSCVNHLYKIEGQID